MSAVVSPPDLLQAARRIGETVAGPAAADVDRRARFPVETLAALRAEGLLAAYIPTAYGGLGRGLLELVDIAQTLAQHCASSAMIWAMHQIQVACIVHHGLPAPFFARLLGELAERQLLIASVTSEVGVGGDIRTSRAAVERQDGVCRLAKHGSTISYGEHADCYLVTARRDPEAPSGEQVLALLRRSATALEQTGAWDTLGMRGTCSPAFRVAGDFPPEQILPAPFADICAQTMVPFSHILWSACWLGVATDAVERARGFVRARARQAAGPPAGDVRLAEAAVLLQQMRATVYRGAEAYAEQLCRGDRRGDALGSLGFAIEMNQLKVAASELVVQIVAHALAVCGMAGYVAGGPYSVERHLRDAYSAICMISNQRLRAANATLLLAHQGR